MSTTPNSTLDHPREIIADLQCANAELQRRLDERTDERDEALQREIATAEVLQVINSSPGDLAPVFDAMLEKAINLCGAAFGILWTYDGELFHVLALRNVPPLYAEFLREPHRAGPLTGLGRVAAGEPFAHIEDMLADDAYLTGDPVRRAGIELARARTHLSMPLRKDQVLLGNFAVFRNEVRPFSDKQIALIQNFAAQAVIAMENARLITETREALEQQTATAEVLQVINSSPGDLGPVFDAMLERAVRLCDAHSGTMYVQEGDCYRAAALGGVPEEFAEFLRREVIPLGPDTLVGRVMRERSPLHIADVTKEEPYLRGVPIAVATVELGGTRTALIVPLLKDESLLGIFQLRRREVRPFTDKQIALVQNFAAQAVIAMENARLITETREALEQQTATAEILGVINSSPGELGPVFDAMLEKAMRLCEAAFGHLDTYDGNSFHTSAIRGVPAAYAEYRRNNPPNYGPGTGPARMLAGERIVHHLDMMDEEAYRRGEQNRRALVDLGGARSAINVALVKDRTFLEFITLFRQEVRPFSDKQIALLQNFAAQAVIAIENARLITETREALEQQTATSEVLQVINSSPGDLTPVFDAMLEKAVQLCEFPFAALWTYKDARFAPVAFHNMPPAFEAFLREHTPPGVEALRDTAAPIHLADVLASELALQRDPAFTGNVQELGRVRTLLLVPLRRDDALVGAFVAYRQEVRPFTDKQIALLQNFAAQAVIAMENARLITETREARDDAEAALGHLKAAQANLIQAEKMASLGQLTAGIAHEIKNPLNFVNNFANLSVELLDELKETTAPAVATLDDNKRAEVDETIELLTGNLEKIAEHGRRADGIVKSMLEHSRGSTGERREVDLNGLIEEALNLAYHGARAQDQSFNITLERDFDTSIAPIELVPQDITRVCLNLFGNGFYAANKRERNGAEPGYRPVLTVATRDLDDAVEVRIRDNGTGISPEIKDKLFQPFFTTKPTGEGTGLGLSISYDIVTQQHGGTITVESEPGAFTEFTIRLPRH